MSSKGIRSNGITLRAQEQAAADHAVYDFDLDYEGWHKRAIPNQGRNSWSGINSPFPSSFTAGARPWQIYLRFGNWESEYEKYLMIRASKKLPKRASHKPEEDKEEEAKEDAEDEATPSSSTANHPAPAAAVPPLPRRNPLGYASVPSATPLSPAFKPEDNDDLGCSPSSRNAILVHARLFAVKYQEGKKAEMQLVDSVIKQKDALRSPSPGFELLEIKVPWDKLSALPTSIVGGQDTKPMRYLRLEVTTLFNHDFARTMVCQPDQADMQKTMLYCGVGHYPLRKAPHDLRLFFPDVGPDGAELWTSSNLLDLVSSYFQDLFASGFAESVTRHGKRPRLASPAAVEAAQPAQDPAPTPSGISASIAAASTSAVAGSSKEEDVEEAGAKDGKGDEKMQEETASPAGPTFEEDEDSDVELDALVVKRAPQLLRAPDADAETEYRQVTVRGQTAWMTYRAVLVYAASGYVEFGLMRSYEKTLGGPPYLETLKEESDKDFLESTRDCPIPASPKSIFRLAHLLQMYELSNKALSEFCQQLDVDNVLQELFSSTASKYDELRSECMTFATNNWSEVKRSKAFKEIKAKVASGEVPHAAPILMELLEAK